MGPKKAPHPPLFGAGRQQETAWSSRSVGGTFFGKFRPRQASHPRHYLGGRGENRHECAGGGKKHRT